MSMQGVTVESLGRVYNRLTVAVPVATKGEQAVDVIAALLLLAMLIEKQRPGKKAHDHRQAVLDLVGKLYDMAENVDVDAPSATV